MTEFWPLTLDNLNASQERLWIWFFCPEEVASNSINIVTALHSLMPHIKRAAPDASLLDIFQAIQDNLVHREMSLEAWQKGVTFYCLRRQPQVLFDLPWDVDEILENNSACTWRRVKESSLETGSLEHIWHCADLLPKTAYQNIFSQYLKTASPELLNWLQDHEPKHLVSRMLTLLLKSPVEYVERFEHLILPKFLGKCNFFDADLGSLRYLAGQGFFGEVDPEFLTREASKCYNYGFATGAEVLLVTLDHVEDYKFLYQSSEYPRKFTKAIQYFEEIRSVERISQMLGHEKYFVMDVLRELLKGIDPKIVAMEEKKEMADYLCQKYDKDYNTFPFVDLRLGTSKCYDKCYLEYGLLSKYNIHNVRGVLMKQLIPKYGVETIQKIMNSPVAMCHGYQSVKVMLEAGITLYSEHLTTAWEDLLVPSKEKLCKSWFQEHIAHDEKAVRNARTGLIIAFFRQYLHPTRALYLWKLGEELFGITLSDNDISQQKFYRDCKKKTDGSLVRHFLDKDEKNWHAVAGMISCMEENAFYDLLDSYDMDQMLEPHLPHIMSCMRYTESRPNWWFQHFPDLDGTHALFNADLYSAPKMKNLHILQSHFEILDELSPDSKIHYCHLLRAVFVIGDAPRCEENYQTRLHNLGNGIYCVTDICDYNTDEGRELLRKKAKQLIANRKTKSAMK